jgi:hypothetical protein
MGHPAFVGSEKGSGVGVVLMGILCGRVTFGRENHVFERVCILLSMHL